MSSPPGSEGKNRINFNGLVAVPTGPKIKLALQASPPASKTGETGPYRLNAIPTEELLPPVDDFVIASPHAFIPSDCLPVNPSTVKHLIGYARRYKPKRIYVDQEGYYVVFGDDADGHMNLDTLVGAAPTRDKLFGIYALRLEAYHQGQLAQRPLPQPSPDVRKDTHAVSRIESASSLVDRLVEDRERPLEDEPVQVDEAETHVNKGPGLQNRTRSLKQLPASDDGPAPHTAHRPVTDSARSDPLRYSSPLRVPSRQDRDDASSISGRTTASSDISASRRLKCHVCNNASALDIDGLVHCASCPRRYHRRCHMTPPIPSVVDGERAWQCRRCAKKRVELPERQASILPDVLPRLEARTSPRDERPSERPRLQELGEVEPRKALADATERAAPDIGETSMAALRTNEVTIEANGRSRVLDLAAHNAVSNDHPADVFAVASSKDADSAPAQPDGTKDTNNVSEVVSNDQQPSSIVATWNMPQQQPDSGDMHFDAALDLVEQSFANPEKVAQAKPASSNKTGKLNLKRTKIARPQQGPSHPPPDTAGEIGASSKPGLKTVLSKKPQVISQVNSTANPTVHHMAGSDAPDSTSLKDVSTAVGVCIDLEVPESPAELRNGSSAHPQPLGSVEQRQPDETASLVTAFSVDKVVKRKPDRRVGTRVAAPGKPSSLTTGLPADEVVQRKPDRTFGARVAAPGKLQAKRTPQALFCSKCRKNRAVPGHQFGKALCLACKPQGEATTEHAKPAQVGPMFTIAKASASGTSGHQETVHSEDGPSTRSEEQAPEDLSASQAVPQHEPNEIGMGNQAQKLNPVDTSEVASCRAGSAVGELQPPSIADTSKGPETHAGDDLNFWTTSGATDTSSKGAPTEVAVKIPLGDTLLEKTDKHVGGPRADASAKLPSGSQPTSNAAHGPEDLNTSDEELSELPGSPEHHGQAESGRRKRRNYTGGVFPGNSYERPLGTYVRLVGMALCDVPDHCLQIRGICHWIAMNIPGYKLGVSKWEHGIDVTIDAHTGDKGKRMFRQLIHHPGDSDEHGKRDWFEMRADLVEAHERWDPVLKQAVSPLQERRPKGKFNRREDDRVDLPTDMDGDEESPEQQRDGSPSQAVRDRCAKARAAKASKRIETLQQEGSALHEDAHMDDDTLPTPDAHLQTAAGVVDELRVDVASSDDEPLQILRQRQSTKFVAPPAMMQSSPVSLGKHVELGKGTHTAGTAEALSALATNAGPSLPAMQEGQPKPHMLQIEPTSASNLSLAQLIRLESENISYGAKSLFKEWPEYHPANQLDRVARMAEIKKRPTRKQMFGKPAMYSRLASNEPAKPSQDSSKSEANGSNGTPMRANQPPRHDSSLNDLFSHEDGIRYFDTIEEFFDMPKNPIPVLHYNKLAYRDGTRDENGNLPRATTYYPIGPA